MSNLLLAVACILMGVNALIYWGIKAADLLSITERIPCQLKSGLKLLVILGVVTAFGGFWFPWMLGAGIIISEIGCLCFLIRIQSLTKSDQADSDSKK